MGYSIRKSTKISNTVQIKLLTILLTKSQYLVCQWNISCMILQKKRMVQFNSQNNIALVDCTSIAETSNYSKIAPNFFSFVYVEKAIHRSHNVIH